MFAMILTVVLLYLLYTTNCEVVRYRCDEDNAPESVNFKSLNYIVDGRYTMEWCSRRMPKVVKALNIDLWYINGTWTCNSLRKPKSHSVLNVSINDPTNCTNVCYQLDLDLIFSALYTGNVIYKFTDNTESRPHVLCYPVKNNYTLAFFNRNHPYVSYIRHANNEAALHWYAGLPITDYEVSLTELTEQGNEIPGHLPLDVTDNCTLTSWNEVQCHLTLPLGYYNAFFRHNPPWTSVLNKHTEISYRINHTEPSVPEVLGDTAVVWWLCGATLLATAALIAAVVVRRILRTKNYHKQVLESWIRDRQCEPPRPLDPRPEKPNILILYAREGEHGQRAVTALKSLLQQTTGVQVLDIYSAEVLSLAAPAPGAWLQHTLLAPHTSVVLLQSPATQALFDTNVNHDLNLQEPLLGRRAMYRSPQFGDQLLQLAFRLMAETVAVHHDYCKYFLATYASLESDIVQQVVPYRRYVLPAAVVTLLRDLAVQTSATPTAEPDPDPALLKHFYDSVERFVSHVNDNPDYLIDELMIM